MSIYNIYFHGAMRKILCGFMQNLVPTKFCSNREQKTNKKKHKKKTHNITKTDNKTTIKSFLTETKFCCAKFIFISENTIFFQLIRRWPDLQ